MLQRKARIRACSLVASLHSGSASATRSYTSTDSSSTSIPLPPRPPRSAPLAGTVPYHTSYLVLHATEPPSTWPAKFDSHVYLHVQKRLREIHGLVNFCWFGEQSEVAARDGSKEGYRATLWNKAHSQDICHRLDIPIISEKKLDTIVGGVPYWDTDSRHEVVASTGPYFYVCTHGNRDCRCGVRGSQLFGDLKTELLLRGMLFDENGKPRLGEIGHVSGHKNAPNLLVFPHGDWYGNLECTDLPGLIDYYLWSLEERPISTAILSGPNRYQWRGRLGMTRQEQSDAFRSHVLKVPEMGGFLLE